MRNERIHRIGMAVGLMAALVLPISAYAQDTSPFWPDAGGFGQQQAWEQPGIEDQLYEWDPGAPALQQPYTEPEFDPWEGGERVRVEDMDRLRPQWRPRDRYYDREEVERPDWEYWPPQYTPEPQRRRAPRRRAPTQPGIVQLQGRITDMASVWRDGRQYVFARIETPQGRTATVNLGSIDRVDRLQLYPGDIVRVRGTRTTVNGRPVMTASEVSITDQRAHNPSMQAARVRGLIMDTRTCTPPGAEEPHVIGLVRLDRGHHRITVDFGPRRHLRDHGIRIRAGRDVTVMGQSTWVGEQRVFFARTIDIDGRQIDVQRIGWPHEIVRF